MKKNELLKLGFKSFILLLLSATIIESIYIINVENREDYIYNIYLIVLQLLILISLMTYLFFYRKVKEEKALIQERTQQKEDELILKIDEIIQSKLSDSEFNVVEIEKAIGVSRPVLLNRFKRVKGTTLVNYIKKERLKKAEELLLSSSDNISEIAYKVGFSDPKYFSKVFRQDKELTPTEYRRQKQFIE
ncbi:AraC family transcriptional regulator [Flammeovirga sp. EKP202]|uniref:helix-turn-helix domain-containing protein n=1 Tax=Flammeovirga sp. EKP202 TaxID=2770592 RepID=UPI00165FB613|nr:AraC family transcriptional regulator [Flammeovirga sp. EKP202]MBD0400629.1 helix-turn-helix transcriptional regulator [Flammeovirga sp. EKP202]